MPDKMIKPLPKKKKMKDIKGPSVPGSVGPTRPGGKTGYEAPVKAKTKLPATKMDRMSTLANAKNLAPSAKTKETQWAEDTVAADERSKAIMAKGGRPRLSMADAQSQALVSEARGHLQSGKPLTGSGKGEAGTINNIPVTKGLQVNVNEARRRRQEQEKLAKVPTVDTVPRKSK